MDDFDLMQKLAGHFQLIMLDGPGGISVFHCFGELGRTGVTDEDVRCMCRCSGIPYHEDWRREDTQDIGASFYIIIP